MANRAKRLEREMTLAKERRKVKSRFFQKKLEHKVGLRPLLDVLVEVENIHELTHFKRGKDAQHLFRQKLSMQKNRVIFYPTFLEILQHPKLLFTHLRYYEKLVEALFEIPVCRSLSTWKMPKSKSDNVLFKSLFCHLFSPYTIPKFVERAIYEYGFLDNHFTHTYVHIIYRVVKGHGVSTKTNPYINLNGKMNFLFHQAPVRLDIPEAMWWAKIKSMGVSHSVALQLVDNLKIHIEKKWEDWHDELMFFVNRNKDVSHSDLRKIITFLLQQKEGGVYIKIPDYEETTWISALYPEFSLQGRTVASVLRFVYKWENYLEVIKKQGYCKVFKKSEVRPLRKTYNKSQMSIRQITSLKGLHKEGHHMNHCVVTYANTCIQGTSSIWSLRQMLSNGKIKLMVTIELIEETKRIGQVYGKNNRDPKIHEKALVRAWAKQEGLVYVEHDD